MATALPRSMPAYGPSSGRCERRRSRPPFQSVGSGADERVRRIDLWLPFDTDRLQNW
jgi:hypothetical protein